MEEAELLPPSLELLSARCMGDLDEESEVRKRPLMGVEREELGLAHLEASKGGVFWFGEEFLAEVWLERAENRKAGECSEGDSEEAGDLEADLGESANLDGDLEMERRSSPN